MSDDEVVSRHGKKKVAVERLEDRSTPEPLDEKFVKWVESQFHGDEQAETIVVQQLLGRTGKVEGDTIRRRPVSHLKDEGGVKKEELVSLCNDLIEEMQDEADNMRATRRFVVKVHNAKKGGFFGSRVVTREPRLATLRAIGSRDPDDGDEIDPMGGDILRKRSEVILADAQFYAELNAKTFGGITNMLIQQTQMLMEQNNQLFQSNMAYARQVNEAENNKLDRDLIRAEREVMLGMKRKGMSMLAGLLPGFLQKITDGSVEVPGGRTAESMAIEAIMDEKNGGLTHEEKYKIFGEWTDSGERLAPGILTERQVQIIVGILNEKIPVTDMDMMIKEGSKDRLTEQQYVQIMAVLGGEIDKLMPLVNILQERKAALDKQAATNAAPPKQET